MPLQLRLDGEYEIFEFDLGSTFNYAEMAALIARGRSWSNAATSTAWRPDEWVALRVRQGAIPLQARLGSATAAGSNGSSAAHDPRPRHLRLPAQASGLAFATAGMDAQCASPGKSQPPAPRVPLLRRSSELPAFSALLLRSSGTRKSARSSGTRPEVAPAGPTSPSPCSIRSPCATVPGRSRSAACRGGWRGPCRRRPWPGSRGRWSRGRLRR